MVKKIISYILTFILFLTLLASIVTVFVSQTILKESYVLSILIRNNYYANTYEEIMQTFENNTIQSGLTEDVLDGIITQEKVRSDFNQVVSYVYGSARSLNIDVKDVENKLRENIQKQIKENNKTVDPEEQKDIDEYVKTIVNIYKEQITCTDKYLDSVKSVIVKAKKYISLLRNVAIVASVILILLILLINKTKSVNYINISLFANAIALIFVKIMESTSMQIRNILLLSQSFSKVLINLIENVMTGLCVIGVISFLIGIIITIIAKEKDVL